MNCNWLWIWGKSHTSSWGYLNSKAYSDNLFLNSNKEWKKLPLRGHSYQAPYISPGLRCSHICRPGVSWHESSLCPGPWWRLELHQSQEETWDWSWPECVVYLCQVRDIRGLGSEHRNHYPIFCINKLYVVPLSGRVLCSRLWHPKLTHDKTCNKYLVSYTSSSSLPWFVVLNCQILETKDF